MDKLEKVMDMARKNEFKLDELLGKKKEEEKKCNTFLWVFAIVGVVAAVAAISYAVYRYLTPDYLDDFEDDLEDDFEEDEDDFFEDEGEK